MNTTTHIGITTDMAYDLAQVVDLPDRDEQPNARAHVVGHFGEIWAGHVRRIAADWGYDRVDVYWDGDDSVAHDIRTRTPRDDEREPTVEDSICQVAHDSYDVDQDDIDRVAAEVTG